MTEAERRRAFAAAFIAQARSDWRVFELLSDQSNTDACHRHHYLQMACEKLAKAYRLRDTNAAVDDLVKSHVGFAKFIQPYMLSTLKEQYQGREAQLATLIRDARAIAREIEKMAPAVDRTNAPENAEYPWEQAGQITAPCKYTYPGLDLLRKPGGRAFLKLVKNALDDFEVAHP